MYKERTRTREEMASVFIDNLELPSWLLLSLLRERLSCIDEGDTGSLWSKLVNNAIDAVLIGDMAQAERHVKTMASFQGIEVKENEES